jgi:hypothetical protein
MALRNRPVENGGAKRGGRLPLSVPEIVGSSCSTERYAWAVISQQYIGVTD